MTDSLVEEAEELAQNNGGIGLSNFFADGALSTSLEEMQVRRLSAKARIGTNRLEA